MNLQFKLFTKSICNPFFTMPIIKQIYFTHPNANNMKCGLQNALAELVR